MEWHNFTFSKSCRKLGSARMHGIEKMLRVGDKAWEIKNDVTQCEAFQGKTITMHAYKR